MDARAAESLLSLAEDASARLRGPGAKEALQQLEDQATNMEWPPDERPLALLPEAMGPAECDRARAAGQGTAPTEAVAFALSAR